jgi:hypothetical protein
MPKQPKERVETLHPDPERSAPRISRPMYEAVRKAILEAVPRIEPGLPFKQLPAEVEKWGPRHTFDNASVIWFTVTVKLDLEASGLVRRLPEPELQRLVRGYEP